MRAVFIRNKTSTGFYSIHCYDYQIHCYILRTNFDICKSLPRCIYVSQADFHDLPKFFLIHLQVTVSCLYNTITHMFLPYVVESLHMLTFAQNAWFRKWHICHERICLQQNTTYHSNCSFILIVFSPNHPIVYLACHILSWKFVVASQPGPILSGLEGPQQETVTLV